ncbi:alpha/beta fold hydrolase [Ottowia thiooxydans]|uniref:3-oxoadipate enol-lactonase n=1 Tax=Ottowia thiooxydans TaxID=219182 RepID=A0ABV2Q6J0_9BURK
MMPTGPTTQTLTSSDGVPIHYRVHGSCADLPVVALIHSLAMDHRFWDPVAKLLEGQACVVAIDARGHGKSGRGTARLTAARMADDLLEVLDALQIRKAVVGGASMGGCLALQFAGTHPERCSGLALIDTTAWYGPTAPKDWEDRAMKAKSQGLSALVDFQKTRWFSEAFSQREPGVVDECIAIFLSNDIDAYVDTCRMMGAFDGRGLFANIHVPTRILVGDEDYAAPVAMAQVLHEGIAGSRLEIIPGARHLTPLEVPHIVADTLRALCQEDQQ